MGRPTRGGLSDLEPVFELSPNGGGGWNETVLYSFDGGLNIGPDGAGPSGPVIFDRMGNLYGTTRFGGTDYIYCSYGGMWKISARGSKLNRETRPPFGESAQGDGIAPMNNFFAVSSTRGNLYGAGAENGPVVQKVHCFTELSPSVGGWTYQRIYSAPTSSGLTMDAAGNIYGATSSTVFELSPNGNGGWNPTAYYPHLCRPSLRWHCCRRRPPCSTSSGAFTEQRTGAASITMERSTY